MYQIRLATNCLKVLLLFSSHHFLLRLFYGSVQSKGYVLDKHCKRPTTHLDLDCDKYSLSHTHPHIMCDFTASAHTFAVDSLKLSLLPVLRFSAPGLVDRASREERFTAGRETQMEGMCLQLHHTRTKSLLGDRCSSL